MGSVAVVVWIVRLCILARYRARVLGEVVSVGQRFIVIKRQNDAGG